MNEAEMQQAIIELVNALNDANLRTAAFMLTVSTILTDARVCTEEELSRRLDESLAAAKEEQRLADPHAPTASELVLP